MSTSTIVFAGIVGTTVMTLIVQSFYYLGWSKLNLLKALGSFISHSERNSLLPGLLLHYSFGIFFSLFYGALLLFAPTSSVQTSIMLTSFAGFLHGLVVGIVFTIMIAEHHPLAKFKVTGFGDVFAHIIGHVAYGFSVGATITLMSIGEFLPGTRTLFPFKDVLGYFSMWAIFWGVPLALAVYAYAPWALQKRDRTLGRGLFIAPRSYQQLERNPVMENSNYPQNWSEIKGAVISQWSQVSEDELEDTMGDFDAIVSLLQEKYGESKDEISLTLSQVVSPYGMHSSPSTDATPEDVSASSVDSTVDTSEDSPEDFSEKRKAS